MMEQKFNHTETLAHEWFYEKNGQRIGAISQSQMIDLIQTGGLHRYPMRKYLAAMPINHST
jgi:hypothetical protein